MHLSNYYSIFSAINNRQQLPKQFSHALYQFFALYCLRRTILCTIWRNKWETILQKDSIRG